MIRRWLERLKHFLFHEKSELNGVYFLLFFLAILAMTVSHFYFWESPLMGIPLFFLLQALGQVLLEAGLFFLLGFALNRWAPRWIFHLFISFSFTILLLHFVDFTIIRLMDASISYMFTYLFGSGIANLATAFQAMNISTHFFFLGLFLIALVPLLGIALYRLTQPIADRIRWRFPLSRLGIALSVTCLCLLGLDLTFHPLMTRIAYSKYQKTLPLGTTFIAPQRQCVAWNGFIKPPREEEIARKKMEERKFTAASTPNIYLFIIETLRRDFATPEIAPNLSAFAAQNISCPESYANANGTHSSWFSIFHADIPYHWTAMQNSWKHGSIPLQILKRLGYKINIYSSSDLRLFNIDQLLFGQNRSLIDHLADFTEDRTLEPCDRDALCLSTFFNDLAKPEGKSGNLYIFFLDSTHSEYSVPKNFPLKFLPISGEIDYLTLSPKEIEPLKNKYRNAIHYVDTLLGSFFSRLKADQLYDDSIIAITGDHGEEFFEEGALFHGTHLNRYQTAVPLIYKFKNNPLAAQSPYTTHLDIFPSILHYLTKQSDYSELFDGQSLFHPRRWPYRIAVLQNGPETPLEFSIQNTSTTFRFRFLSPDNIYDGNRLETLTPISQDESTLLQSLAPLIVEN